MTNQIKMESMHSDQSIIRASEINNVFIKTETPESDQLVQECLEKRAMVLLQRLQFKIVNIYPASPVQDSSPNDPMEEQSDPLEDHGHILSKKKRIRIRNPNRNRKRPPSRIIYIHCPFKGCSEKIPHNQKNTFEFHKLTHTVPNLMEHFKNRTCPKCDSRPGKNHAGFYRIHVLKHYISDLEFKCKFPGCDKKFSTKFNMGVHAASHSSKSFPCKICSVISPTAGGYLKHKFTYHSPFKCSLCPKGYSSKEFLEKHEEKHKEQGVCQICGKFMELAKLKEHIWTKHNYKCKMCAQEFKSSQELSSHIKESHVREWVCHKCGKSFYTNDRLDSHLNRCKPQDIDTPLECTFKGCGMKFNSNQKSYFERHQKKHESEARIQNKIKEFKGQKFPCGECERIFINIRSRKTHIMRAHTIITFACKFPDCGESFKTRASYIAHKKGHETWIPCEFCEKTFASPKILGGHIAIKHRRERNLPFKCECGETFFKPRYLKKHMKNKHLNSLS